VTFDKINRRVHLYLGLALAPWLLMYGVSSFIVIHESWFGAHQAPAWEPVSEQKYSRPVNMQGANSGNELRAAAQQILKDCDMEGAFWVDKPKPDVVQINRFTFWGSSSVTYSINEQKLTIERQRLKVPQAITRMHFRGGYGQPDFWNKFWGLLVDIVCASIIIWIVSGFIMWWRLRAIRFWGATAVVAGCLTFLFLVWKL
jgi:hypothetical protein